MSEWTERPELATYLTRQRWFSGADSEVVVHEVRTLDWLNDPATGLGVRFEFVTTGSGGVLTTYNVPLSYRLEVREDLSSGFVGVDASGDAVFYVYDALHDPEARRVLLAGFSGDPVETAALEAETTGGIEYGRLGDFALERDPDTVLLGAEQSNTSVIAGDALVKFFRKLMPGRNPDIEVQEALTLVNSEEISPLLGWISSGDVDLAMVGAYQRSATDGWDSARASVRALQDDDIRARDAGGDFAGESERLGVTLALVHDQMRQLLPVDTWGRNQLAELVARLNARLDAAAAVYPSLQEGYADRVRAAYDRINLDSPLRVQRVHGDFHLGQTLRTTAGWKIIDFEGEPSQQREDRIRLDSVVRDIAGMLRSLDYAAHSVSIALGGADSEHAEDWVSRNRSAFLRGYGLEPSTATEALLRAYEIDKAVYEVVYEINHRPDWTTIPLRALDRLL
jgi:maltokinase